MVVGVLSKYIIFQYKLENGLLRELINNTKKKQTKSKKAIEGIKT